MVLVRKRKRKAAIASLIMKIRWRESFNLEWILCSFLSFFLSHSKQFIKSGPQKTFCSTFIIFRHSYSAHIKKGRYLYSTLLLRHYTLRKRRKLFSSFYLFFRYYRKVAGRSVSRPRPEYKCAIPDLYYTQLLAFRKCGCC